MPLMKDTKNLEVYLEGRKRRTHVGTLSFEEKSNYFIFQYDSKYIKSRKAIPIGPDLSIFKKKHISAKGKLFPSFADRIPSRSNPAYEEYCKSQGISLNEKNEIILLGTIGRRGPSSFIFEPIMQNNFSATEIVRFRQLLDLSRNELALALDVNELTLQRLESLKSKDQNTLKRLQIYFEFPQVALWQISITGGKLSNKTLERLKFYFENQINRTSKY